MFGKKKEEPKIVSATVTYEFADPVTKDEAQRIVNKSIGQSGIFDSKTPEEKVIDFYPEKINTGIKFSGVFGSMRSDLLGFPVLDEDTETEFINPYRTMINKLIGDKLGFGMEEFAKGMRFIALPMDLRYGNELIPVAGDSCCPFTEKRSGELMDLDRKIPYIIGSEFKPEGIFIPFLSGYFSWNDAYNYAINVINKKMEKELPDSEGEW